MLPPADQALLDALGAGAGEPQRRAVAKAITLLESQRADHRERADALLVALPAPARTAFRIGNTASIERSGLVVRTPSR